MAVITITEAERAEEDSWIRSFSRVVRLELRSNAADGKWGASYSMFPFIPFHGFSPVLKHLRKIGGFIPNRQVFNLISTPPLLEDLDGLCEEGASRFGAPQAVL